MLTRRDFVSVLAVLTAAGGGGWSLAHRRRLAHAQVDGAALADLAGSRVELVAPDGARTAARLAHVRTHRRPGRHGAPAVEELSIRLQAGGRAEGGIYRLAATDRECEEMLFTAVGREGRDRRLEAVLTRIV